MRNDYFIPGDCMIHEQLLQRGIRNSMGLETIKRVPHHESVPPDLVSQVAEGDKLIGPLEKMDQELIPGIKKVRN